jgi:hypothetical protein
MCFSPQLGVLVQAFPFIDRRLECGRYRRASFDASTATNKPELMAVDDA